MDITLVIASYNGAETIGKSLSSLNRVRAAEHNFNIIYIDNNSSDNTLGILKNYKFTHPIQILQQKKRGKNAALNTIFEFGEHLGEVIIFSDDDVIFPESFVEKYANAVQEHPDIMIFGGRIDAHWPSEPSQAMLDGIDEVVAFAITPVNRGYATGIIEPEKLHGPNVAFRKTIFSDGLRFNEDIGPNGGAYMMGSESELLLRLKAKGLTAWYLHDNPVKHIISEDQFSDKWITNRAFKAGRSFVMHQLRSNSFRRVPEVFGYPRWAFFLSLKFKLIALLSRKSNSVYYNGIWQSHHLKGYCFEYKKSINGEVILGD